MCRDEIALPMARKLTPQITPYSKGLRDMLQLHLVVLAWGLTAILGKLITLPPVEVTVWRTALAASGLAVIAWIIGLSLRVPGRVMLQLFGTGVLIGWHWASFFLSARLSTASVCLAAMPTIMIWCSLIEPLMNGSRRWSKAELLTGAVMVGAVWIIYQFEFRHWLGFTVGLASALIAAVFSVINKFLTEKHPPVTICCYQMIGACVACLLLLPLASAQLPALPSTTDFLWLLVLSQVCTVGAYLGYLDVLRRMSVFTVNVVYNMEPVYGIILAALIFGDKEHMSGGFYLGAGIIIVIVTVMPWLQRRTKRDQPPLSPLGE
jgi:drug/metabolite transporter (DMT)-like permease